MAARNGKWERSEMEARERGPRTHGPGGDKLHRMLSSSTKSLAAPSPLRFIHTRDLAALVMPLFHPTPHSTLTMPTPVPTALASPRCASPPTQHIGALALFPSRPPIPFSSFPSSIPLLCRRVSVGQDCTPCMRSGSHSGQALCLLLVVASGHVDGIIQTFCPLYPTIAVKVPHIPLSSFPSFLPPPGQRRADFMPSGFRRGHAPCSGIW
jgi:hypothetical protein